MLLFLYPCASGKANHVSKGVVTLFQNPDQLAELKADPEKWAGPFVEELCRYHTASAMAMKRTAKEDVEIGGKVGQSKTLARRRHR